MFSTRTTSTAGNSVIEVLVATAVVGIILTALAASMSSSIQNSAEAQYRETGTSLGQDIMETLRKDKNILSWSVFYDTPANGTYCVPTNFTSVATGSLSSVTLANIGSCPYVVRNNVNYYRAITKTSSTDNTATPPVQMVKYVVHTYWNVGIANKQRSTTVEQTFYKSY